MFMLVLHVNQVLKNTPYTTSTEADCRAIASTLGPTNLFPCLEISIHNLVRSTNYSYEFHKRIRRRI